MDPQYWTRIRLTCFGLLHSYFGGIIIRFSVMEVGWTLWSIPGFVVAVLLLARAFTYLKAAQDLPPPQANGHGRDNIPLSSADRDDTEDAIEGPSAEEQIHALEEQDDAVEERLLRILAKVKRHSEEQIRRLEEQRPSLEEQIWRLKEQIRRSEDEIRRLEDQGPPLEEQILLLKNQIQRLEEQRAPLEEQIRQLEEQRPQLAEQIRRLEEPVVLMEKLA